MIVAGVRAVRCVVAKKPAAKASSKRDREIEVRAPTPPTVQAPLPFAAILGHDRSLARLTDAMRSGRVHHAWVFHGPGGVGKFTAALAFAALLLDPTTQETFGGELVSDPESATRRLLDSGTHPDLHVVTKELAQFHPDAAVRKLKLTNIPLDVIREFLIAPANIAASVRTEARAAKVFIVDEAELMAGPSQNAVLKLLEEPPPRTVIILVTASEERLLPTIRSRCQRVYFGPLGQPDMLKWLKSAAPELSPKDRDYLLDFAHGCPGVLLGAAKAGLPAWREAIAPLLDDAAKGRYSPVLGPTMAELIEAWAKGSVESGDEGSKSAANKAGADWMLRLIAAHARGLARSAGTREVSLRWADAIRDTESLIDANVTLLFAFEKLSCDLADGAASPVR